MFYITELIKSCLWGVAGIIALFAIVAIAHNPF